MTHVRITHSLDGGCLCGAVRYRVAPCDADSAYCHCRLCQRASGAPAVAWFSIDTPHFTYIRGCPKTYRSSQTATRDFCGTCGSPLLFRLDDGARVDVNTVTLDEPLVLPPRYHIWRMSQIAWFESTDNLPRYDDRGPDV